MPLRRCGLLPRFCTCLLTSLALFIPTGLTAQINLQATPRVIVGSQPLAVTAADLNGDHKADLVVANDADGTISVLISSGDGTFQTAVDYNVGEFPEQEAIADFNGDGKLDLAVSLAGAKQISVLLGNGDGTFQAAVPYTTSDDTIGIAAADFNGDGKLDIAATDLSGNLDILLGNGDGTFGAAHTLTTPANPSGLAVGDFNGDGHADIAVIINGNSSSTVNIYLGSGSGTFTAGATYTFVENLMQIAAADLNLDGKIDLVVTDSGVPHGSTPSISVMLGNGDGSFAAAVNYPALPDPLALTIADFNGDGKPDIAETDASTDVVHLWLGDGTGAFTSSLEYAVGLTPQGICSGDFNGDGKTDLASANSGSNDVSILVGRGDGTFRGARTFELGNISIANNIGNLLTPTAVLGDFNADGKLDLALGTSGVSLLLGNGDGTLQAATSLNVAQGQVVGPLLAGDFNKDGKLDLVAAAVLNIPAATGVAVELLNNGTGTFTAANFDLTADKSPYGIATADFNSDGNPDLLIVSNAAAGARSYTLLGDGTGNFQSKLFVGIDGMNSVATTDFNNDGKADAIGFTGTSLLLGLGVGDGTFTGSTLAYTFSGTTAPSSTSIVTSDFNGDGNADVAVVNNSLAGTVSVLLGKGDGTFQTPVNYAVGTSSQSIAVTDIDKDGHPDLVVAGSGTLAILRGNGDGTFQSAVVLSSPGETVSVAVGDLDGDGYPDVVISNSVGTNPNTLGTATVYLNQGPGIISTSTALSSSLNPAVVGGTVTFTATVTQASGTSTPTGPVVFMDGTTDLSTVGLSGGTASYTSSTLTTGSHNVTAVYSGDSHYSGSSSSAVVQVITAYAFTIAASGSSSATVTAGTAATYQLTLTTVMAGSQSIALTCGNIPQAATCTASPNPVTLSASNASSVTITVQTTAATTTALAAPPNRPPNLVGRGSQGMFALFFAGVLAIGARRKRRVLALCLLLGMLALLPSCGGNSNSGGGGKGSPGTPSGDYTLNVTASSSAGTQTIQLMLTVK